MRMKFLTSAALIPSDGSFPVLPAIGLVCLAGSILLAYAAIRMRQKEAKAKSAPAKTSWHGTGRFWQAAYGKLSASFLTRRMMQSIRGRLEFGNGYDERGLRRKSALVLVLTASLMTGMLILFSLFSRDILLIGIFAVMLGFMTDTVLDISVARIASRLMRQQLRFHEQLRHRYYEEQSVDGAVEEACRFMLEERAHEMYAQGEKLLDVLSAADTEATFEQYRETAPNKYLKLLGGMCCITREYGDARADGASVFLKSLAHLSEEIRSELFKRDKLLYAMKSLNVLTLLPLFFIQPIRNWAGESFAPMARFYAQGAGSVLEVLMVAITLASYLTVRKLQQSGELRPEHLVRNRWDAWLYRKFLHPVVDRLVPGRYTTKRLNMELLLKRAVSPMRTEDVATRQLLAGTAGFIGVLMLSLALQVQAAHRILYEPSVPEGFLGGKLSPEDQAKLEEEAAFDRSLLITLPKNASNEEIFTVAKNSGLIADLELEAVATRISVKSAALGNNRFMWWEMLLCMLAFVAGWQIPVLSLRFQAGILILDMEDEVARFQTIILMLMRMPRVDVEEMIEWMEMFSLHFREALQACLSDYSAGAVEALSALKAKIPFEPMSMLVGNLILAASDLPIVQAFEELESEKAYGREKRKELNERVVERKRNLGNLVGFIPLYALIVLYLMIPMVVSSMTEMSIFYEQMSSF
jgi:hypothetical protein